MSKEPPPDQGASRDPSDIKSDIGHTSAHFMEGAFDDAMTQKMRFGDERFRVDTPVDENGNVGDSEFGG